MPAREICEASCVTPQSRRREPAGDRGRHPAASGRRVSGPGLAGPPPNALFAEMLRAARELLAVRSPLDAELMVSELLGTWWGQQSSHAARNARRRAEVEELVGEGLVGYAAHQAARPHWRCCPGSPAWALPARQCWRSRPRLRSWTRASPVRPGLSTSALSRPPSATSTPTPTATGTRSSACSATQARSGMRSSLSSTTTVAAWPATAG